MRISQEHRVDRPMKIGTSNEITPDVAILPDTYSIPDLSEEALKETDITEQTFSLEYQGFAYNVTILFEHRPKEERQFDIALIDSQTNDEAGAISLRRIASEKGWDMPFRFIKSQYRENNRRLGLLLFALAADVARRYKEATNIDADKIFLHTNQSSVARTVIDQNWLREHQLSELAHSDNSNLGFIPSSEDDEVNLINMLQFSQRATREEAQKKYPGGSVKLIKTI